MEITLHYCKNADDYAAVITSMEGRTGSNLDSPLAPTADQMVVMERLRTAQAEVEALLCNRFSIPVLRNSGAEYLRYATAIICWWHMEINGKGRELVRQKYEDLIKNLSEISSIVAANGDTIITSVDSGMPGAPTRKSRILGGKRSPYIEDTRPTQPETIVIFKPYR